jgi:hypothetical protein
VCDNDADRLTCALRNTIAFADWARRRHHFISPDDTSLMIALKHWGDRWGGWTKSSPASLMHKTCGCTTGLRLTCECCGEPLSAFDVELEQLPPMANERCELEILNRERNKEKARQRRKSAA